MFKWNDSELLHLFLINVGHLSQDGDKLIRLWIHEVYRVFYDRLIDNEDKEMFFGIVKETTSNLFKQSVEKVVHTHTVLKVISEKFKQFFSSIVKISLKDLGWNQRVSVISASVCGKGKWESSNLV